jgi:hypothetical protein
MDEADPFEAIVRRSAQQIIRAALVREIKRAPKATQEATDVINSLATAANLAI